LGARQKDEPFNNREVKMKIFHIFLIVLFLVNGAIAQSCLPDGISFHTQGEIDSFQINYPNCTQIEGDVMISASGIYNLNGLSVVTSVGGALWIEFCPDLKSLSGLEGFSSVGGPLEINMNDSLTNMTAMGNLTSVSGWLQIENNASLSSLSGLDNLTYIGDYLSISANNSLTNLAELENVTFIGGKLKIKVNPALTSLMGLNNLTSIGGDLIIDYNNALTSLSELDHLTSIGRNLIITYNNALTSLTGLDNIDAATITDLTICNNNNLSTCEIHSICDYLVNPHGIIYIVGNADGCSSQQEVEAACGVGIEDNNLSETHLNIYPNPISANIIIETTAKGQLSILDLRSQEIIKHPITEDKTLFDISNLPSSIYIIRFQNENTVKIGKIIKQ
jgi:hypothetical protein